MIYSDFLEEADLKTYAQSMNSRAKSLHKPARVSVRILRDRIYESAGRCEWCHISIVGQAFEIDHIIGLSNGGSNTASNLAVACPDCNRRKSAKHPATFAQETVARTGIRTALIERVLAHYDMEATVQRNLFAPDPPAPAPPANIPPDDGDDPPPYVWGS